MPLYLGLPPPLFLLPLDLLPSPSAAKQHITRDGIFNFDGVTTVLNKHVDDKQQQFVLKDVSNKHVKYVKGGQLTESEVASTEEQTKGTTLLTKHTVRVHLLHIANGNGKAGPPVFFYALDRFPNDTPPVIMRWPGVNQHQEDDPMLNAVVFLGSKRALTAGAFETVLVKHFIPWMKKVKQDGHFGPQPFLMLQDGEGAAMTGYTAPYASADAAKKKPNKKGIAVDMEEQEGARSKKRKKEESGSKSEQKDASRTDLLGEFEDVSGNKESQLMIETEDPNKKATINAILGEVEITHEQLRIIINDEDVEEGDTDMSVDQLKVRIAAVEKEEAKEEKDNRQKSLRKRLRKRLWNIALWAV